MTRVVSVAVAIGLLFVPRAALAHTLLSELLVKLLLSDIVLAPTGPFESHEAHFRPIPTGREIASGFEVNQLEIPLAMNATIISQLSTIPLGSSSGGYTFSSGGAVDPLSVLPQMPDEFSYVAGFDVAAAERLTVSADLLGRTLRDVGRLVPVIRQFAFVDQAGAFGTSSFEEFARQPGDLTLTVSALGVRFNPRGNFLVSAQVLVPLTKAGLRDRVTPVVGIDYSF